VGLAGKEEDPTEIGEERGFEDPKKTTEDGEFQLLGGRRWGKGANSISLRRPHKNVFITCDKIGSRRVVKSGTPVLFDKR